MMTPPMPHRIVSQSGMLSRLLGATNFPSRPMMMPATMTPMISMSFLLASAGRPMRQLSVSHAPILTSPTKGDIANSLQKDVRRSGRACPAVETTVMALRGSPYTDRNTAYPLRPKSHRNSSRGAAPDRAFLLDDTSPAKTKLRSQWESEG